MSAQLEKQRIRASIRASRLARSESDRIAARADLTERLVELVSGSGARSLSCYLPTPSEPDPEGIIEWGADHGLEVLLPVSLDGYRLEWVLAGGTGSAPGAHGIREPLGERRPGSSVGEADLMLIPACAVDRRGMRLGWGRGYFDRCLASLERRPPVFAIVFDDEVLPEVPAEAHDLPVDGVVTPSAIRRFEP